MRWMVSRVAYPLLYTMARRRPVSWGVSSSEVRGTCKQGLHAATRMVSACGATGAAPRETISTTAALAKRDNIRMRTRTSRIEGNAGARATRVRRVQTRVFRPACDDAFAHHDSQLVYRRRNRDLV